MTKSKLHYKFGIFFIKINRIISQIYPFKTNHMPVTEVSFFG
jgi:hypothetical protein